MDLKALLRTSWDIYLKNFLLICGGFLVAALLGGITFGILIGPMLAGFVALCTAIFKDEKPPFNVIFSRMSFFLPTLLVTVIGGLALVLLSLINFVPVLGWILYPALAAVIMSLTLLVITAISEHGYSVMTAFQFGIRYLLSRPPFLLAIAIFGLITGLISLIIPLIYWLIALFAFPLFALFIMVCLHSTGLTVGGHLTDIKVIKYGGLALIGLMVLGLILWAVFGWRVSTFGSRGFLRGGIAGSVVRSGVSIKGTDAEGNEIKYGIGLRLPKGFPRDIPIQKNATILSTQDLDDGQTAVNYMVDQPVSETLAYFQKELPRKGWRVEEESSILLFSALTAYKGQYRLNVVVLGDDEVSNVTLTVESVE